MLNTPQDTPWDRYFSIALHIALASQEHKALYHSFKNLSPEQAQDLNIPTEDTSIMQKARAHVCQNAAEIADEGVRLRKQRFELAGMPALGIFEDPKPTPKARTH